VEKKRTGGSLFSGKIKMKKHQQACAFQLRRNKTVKRYLVVGLFASVSAFGTPISINSVSLMQTPNAINWGTAIGGDQTFASGTFATHVDSVSGQLGMGEVVVAGSDWTGSGAPAGDDLLMVRGSIIATPQVTFSAPSTAEFAGMGALIQAAGPGQFTASLQVFYGVNSVVTFLSTSDANGDPIFLGVEDSTADITKIVYSLTSGLNFAVDTLYDQTIANSVAQQPPVGAPEPGMMSLLGVALLTLGVAYKKRTVRN
jgi:hypothetical protein